MNIKAKGRVLKILKERGMSQSELSRISGIQQPVISRFDKNGLYKIETLFILAKALDLRIEDLFEVTYINEGSTSQENPSTNEEASKELLDMSATIKHKTQAGKSLATTQLINSNLKHIKPINKYSEVAETTNDEHTYNLNRDSNSNELVSQYLEAQDRREKKGNKGEGE
ncbi:helix-turn-helix domain-containing protein [Bacillus sp. Marseille-P3800]|uniref:helix-turn-helix domain-containing protein n=1 Tax=Bacillus sp. Marseille-P3800 TaxID=2014782 RepID=UPI0021000C05|nr:helix-turn-helix transcriptional regulator [Bacillus sp. Marseille-P3800]